MRPSAFRKSIDVVLACALVAFLLVLPATMQADQAKYFYDELGRLVGVIDGAGNVAVYTYDEVGNLLKIERFTTGTTGIGIFLVTPASGLVGIDVEIQGFGFSATPTDNQVAFNGAPATVVSAAADSIVATVPPDATTGPVTVTNANGTATSPQEFTVLVPPIIVGVDPGLVVQGATTRMDILGFNLANATAVMFAQGGLSATILAGATSQRLPINLSVASTVPADSYTFSVTTPAGVAQSGTTTVTVTPAQPSAAVARLSVFLPFPAQLAPSGTSTGVAPPLSVFQPFPAQVAPSGTSAGVAPPLSVFQPFSAQVAPSGTSAGVAPPVSVEVP